jgi:hypothetical protein
MYMIYPSPAGAFKLAIGLRSRPTLIIAHQISLENLLGWCRVDGSRTIRGRLDET